MSSRNNARNKSSKPSFGDASVSSRNGNQNSRMKKNNNNNGRSRQGPSRVPRAIPVANFESFTYRQPKISRSSRSSCLMAHSEFLQDVTGSAAFTVATSYAVNPGLATSFPWLALEAQGWERYRFRKLDYYYTTSTASTTPGTLIMTPDYDSADIAPASQIVALDYRDRAYSAPWCMELVCSLKPNEMNASYKQHFVRTSALSANQDIKTYDVANLHLCTVGGSAIAWGKLFVDYEVEFFNPQLPPGGSPLGVASTLVGATSLSQTAPWGTAGVTTSLGVGNLTAAGLVLTLTNCSVGAEYLFSMAVAGTTISVFNYASTTGSTAKTNVTQIFNAAATAASLVVTQTCTASTITVTITCTAGSITAGSCFACLVSTSSI